jgi:hypothetical protein
VGGPGICHGKHSIAVGLQELAQKFPAFLIVINHEYLVHG